MQIGHTLKCWLGNALNANEPMVILFAGDDDARYSYDNAGVYIFCWYWLMIDCFGFYAVSTMLWNFEVSPAALAHMLFYETQRNGLLCAKGGVNLDTGTI